MDCITRRSAMAALAGMAAAADRPLVPTLAGDWWSIAGPPELGRFSTAKQEVVDFAIWQARRA